MLLWGCGAQMSQRKLEITSYSKMKFEFLLRPEIWRCQISAFGSNHPPYTKPEIMRGDARIGPSRGKCHARAKVFPKVHMKAQLTSRKEIPNRVLYSLLNVFSISQLIYASIQFLSTIPIPPLLLDKILIRKNRKC